MSKQKSILQGMEHLKNELNLSVDQKPDNKNIDHRNLKKELFFTITLMSVLLLVLVGLMLIDKSTEYLPILAQKLTSFCR